MSEPREEEGPSLPGPDVMLKVGGSATSFRCPGPNEHVGCGCNVFRANGKPGGYRCNACGANFIGEPAR